MTNEAPTVEAVDPETVEPVNDSLLVNAACCISIPRVGFNDHWGCLTDVMGVLGIPITRYSGAFWGHGLQAMFLELQEKGTEWIIAVDYDSMFSMRDMKAILLMMGLHPEIDALTCIQAKRVDHNPMMTKSINGEKQHRVEVRLGDPVQVDTAHFGLTIIRTSALEGLPLPWFHSSPGPDGLWTHDEHIDDDVFFWKLWQEHGRTLYVHSGVSIGHLELVVSVLDDDQKHTYLSMNEWRDANRVVDLGDQE